MSYEQRRDWGRGRGRGRGGDGASDCAASSSAGGPGGRGRHPSHLKGREIGLWYARKQGQKNRDADRQQVRGRVSVSLHLRTAGRETAGSCSCREPRPRENGVWVSLRGPCVGLSPRGPCVSCVWVSVPNVAMVCQCP